MTESVDASSSSGTKRKCDGEARERPEKKPCIEPIDPSGPPITIRMTAPLVWLDRDTALTDHSNMVYDKAFRDSRQRVTVIPGGLVLIDRAPDRYSRPRAAEQAVPLLLHSGCLQYLLPPELNFGKREEDCPDPPRAAAAAAAAAAAPVTAPFAIMSLLSALTGADAADDYTDWHTQDVPSQQHPATDTWDLKTTKSIPMPQPDDDDMYSEDPGGTWSERRALLARRPFSVVSTTVNRFTGSRWCLATSGRDNRDRIANTHDAAAASSCREQYAKTAKAELARTVIAALVGVLSEPLCRILAGYAADVDGAQATWFLQRPLVRRLMAAAQHAPLPKMLPNALATTRHLHLGATAQLDVRWCPPWQFQAPDSALNFLLDDAATLRLFGPPPPRPSRVPFFASQQEQLMATHFGHVPGSAAPQPSSSSSSSASSASRGEEKEEEPARLLWKTGQTRITAMHSSRVVLSRLTIDSPVAVHLHDEARLELHQLRGSRPIEVHMNNGNLVVIDLPVTDHALHAWNWPTKAAAKDGDGDVRMS